MVLLERIAAGEDLLSKAEILENTSGHGDWIYLFGRWREHTLAELRAVYDGNDIPREFEAATITSEHSTPRSTFPYTKSTLELGIWKLQDFTKRLPLAVELEPLQSRAGRVVMTPPARGTADDAACVFIIHGRTAGGFLDSVARFVEQLGLRPIVLAEQANEGSRTIIEKFEANALDAGYSIALLTPEDSAFGPEDAPPPSPNRARQNVILELGYFMAKLGRKNVVALKQEGVEVPTDILGVLYIPLDESGAWKTLLARELLAAGYEIDPKGLLS
jgi:predicted nucleotide-binding protein